MKNETALRKWLRNTLPKGTTCFLQPGLGATVGQPDVLVVVSPSGLLAPIELKVAQQLSNGNLRPLIIRPVQIAWHEAHVRAGGQSFLLLGQPGAVNGTWDCWLLTDCSHASLSTWKRGFSTKKLVRVAVDGRLVETAWWGTLRDTTMVSKVAAR